MAEFATTAWHVDLLFLLGMTVAVGGYSAVVRPRETRTAVFFAAGLILLALTVLSPLDALAREYLLSARMTQHLLLSQIIPPLLLLGLPASAVSSALRRPAVAAVERQIRRPMVAWTAGIGALWLWHWPPLFDLSTGNATVGHLQHLFVLVAGLVFWWPIFSPLRGARIGTLPAVAYLVGACLASTTLGMVLAFAPNVVYAAYRQPIDSYGILPSLRGAGLTAQADQQIGGLLMWVPCCALYVSAIGVVLLRWYTTPEPAMNSRAAVAG
ncbi:MAG: cytochrome c oxidase assembly protein [Dehalococcoidia bacterium]